MPMPSAGSELSHDWNAMHSYPSRGSDADLLNDDLPDFLKEPVVKKAPAASPLVQLQKDHTLEYPLLGFSIFVQPDPDVRDDEVRYAKMFARAYCKRAPSVLEADLVIFSGGADVNPALYGEERHESTFYCTERDETDIALYQMCLENGIPMFGVCRGAQFGSVMNRGKLWQDADGHMGGHPMWDISNGQHIEQVSSVHHQVIKPNTANGMEILATAARSTKRGGMEGKTSVTHLGTHCDIEAFFYPATGFLGVQGHPEYAGYNYYTIWCLNLIKRYFYENPDFDWIGGLFRMKPELIKQRTALANLPKIEIGKEVK